MRVHLMPNALDRDKWDVWVSLDETEPGELATAGESFVIASGETRVQAVKRGATILTDGLVQLAVASLPEGTPDVSHE